jgi:hypothetical protein
MLVGGNSLNGDDQKPLTESWNATREALRSRPRPRNWDGGILQNGGLFCSPSIIPHANIALGQNRGRGRERNARRAMTISTSSGLSSMMKDIGFLALHA